PRSLTVVPLIRIRGTTVRLRCGSGGATAVRAGGRGRCSSRSTENSERACSSPSSPAAKQPQTELLVVQQLNLPVLPAQQNIQGVERLRAGQGRLVGEANRGATPLLGVDGLAPEQFAVDRQHLREVRLHVNCAAGDILFGSEGATRHVPQPR